VPVTEEKLFDFVTLTAEPGIIGGIPQGTPAIELPLALDLTNAAPPVP